jgi:hypothetical protein
LSDIAPLGPDLAGAEFVRDDKLILLGKASCFAELLGVGSSDITLALVLSFETIPKF